MRFMMYQTFKPPASLRKFIRFYWIFETDASESTPFIHPATAAGCAKLAFHYNGRFEIETQSSDPKLLFTSGFQGPTKTSELFIGKENIGVFGVYFSPYALPSLFSVPANELSNRNVEISSLLGNKGAELEDKMVSAKSNNERIKIINSYFERQLTSISNHHNRIRIIASVNHIINRKGLVGIKRLTENRPVSQRQFERNFKSATGFSPKMFSRIVRFENAISMLDIKEDVKLTEVALESGYYDQSHFIRDFKEFAGQHPSAYLAHDLSEFAQN